LAEQKARAPAKGT
jgi:hypothetical protein